MSTISIESCLINKINTETIVNKFALINWKIIYCKKSYKRKIQIFVQIILCCFWKSIYWACESKDGKSPTRSICSTQINLWNMLLVLLCLLPLPQPLWSDGLTYRCVRENMYNDNIIWHSWAKCIWAIAIVHVTALNFNLKTFLLCRRNDENTLESELTKRTYKYLFSPSTRSLAVELSRW